MHFRNTLFSKIIIGAFAIIIFSLIVIGVSLYSYTSITTKYERQEQIDKSANLAQGIAGEAITQKGFDLNKLNKKALTLLTTFSNIQVLLSDNMGKVLYSSEEMSSPYIGRTLPSKVLGKALTKQYSEFGKLDAFFDEPQYCSVISISGSNQKPLGFVIATSNSLDNEWVLGNYLYIFTFLAFIVLVVAGLIIYYATRSLTDALKEMSMAADQIGRGDFAARTVYSKRKDEIGLLAEALNRMALSLAMTEVSRRGFVANVSHELKTPTTSIGGFVDGILDGTIPPERHDEYLRAVSSETKRLSRTVTSMLNLSRIEAGEARIHASQFNVVESLCQIVFGFEKRIEDKNLDIKGLDHDAVNIVADEDLMYQVMYNLTENALKFVNEGGYLEFNFTDYGDKIEISIRNSGAGLTKEEMSRVFERFYKTDQSRSRDPLGVGLGLYITQTIINMHGGDIVVRSVKNEYTEFAFTIPKKRMD